MSLVCATGTAAVNSTEADFLAAVLDRIQDLEDRTKDLEAEVQQQRHTIQELQAEKQQFYPDSPVSMLRDLIWAAVTDLKNYALDVCTLEYLPKISKQWIRHGSSGYVVISILPKTHIVRWANRKDSVCVQWTDTLEDGPHAPSYIPQGTFTLQELDNKNILQQLAGAQEEGKSLGLACIVDSEGWKRWTAKGVTLGLLD